MFHYFRKNLFLYLCLLPFCVLLTEQVIFHRLLPEAVPEYYILTGLFNDLLIPLILLTAAVFTMNVFWTAAFTVSALIVVLSKTLNVILFKNILEIATWSNVTLISAHTNLDSIRTEFGPLYWLKFGGGAAAVLLLAAVMIKAGKNFIRFHHNVKRLNQIRIILLVMILISFWTNFQYVKHSEEIGRGFFRREFIVRPFHVWIGDVWQEKKVCSEKKISTPRIGFDPSRLSEKSRQHLTQWGVLPRKASAKLEGVPDFRKIIIIAVESLNLDYFRTVNPAMPENITPFSDSLMRNYVSLNNYYTGSQPTAWGLDCIFAGRVDFTSDVAMQKNPSVCDLLKERGWQTFYFSPTGRMCFRNGPDFDMVFRPDVSLFQEDIFLKSGRKGSYYWGAGDDEVYEAAEKELRPYADKKFFAVISTIDLHDPYTVTGEAAKLPSTGNRFLDSLRSTDRNLQKFLDSLMSGPLFDEHTLIIVTADHSATFGVNYTKRKDYMPDRIPLILITKDNRLKHVFTDCNKLCSSIDLPPTLLHLLNVPAPDTFMGESILVKSSFAWAKTVDQIFIHLPDRVTYHYLQTEQPRNDVEQALSEFYQVYYPPEP